MKRIILFALALTVLAIPASLYAEGGMGESGGSVYFFPLHWQGGNPIQGGQYLILYGDQAPEAGSWAVRILNEQGAVLAAYPFREGVAELQVPKPSSGYRAEFLDAQNVKRLEWLLAGSRTCNENGACEPGEGETTETCPVDCGSQAQPQDLNAAIGDDRRAADVRLWILALAPLAAIGLVTYLDRRTRE